MLASLASNIEAFPKKSSKLHPHFLGDSVAFPFYLRWVLTEQQRVEKTYLNNSKIAKAEHWQGDLNA